MPGKPSINCRRFIYTGIILLLFFIMLVPSQLGHAKDGKQEAPPQPTPGINNFGQLTLPASTNPKLGYGTSATDDDNWANIFYDPGKRERIDGSNLLFWQGKVVAGGYCDNDNLYIYQWDGNAWSSFGGKTAADIAYCTVLSKTIDNQGNIYMLVKYGGKSRLLMWNNKAWQEIVLNSWYGDPSVILFSNKDNRLYVGGKFTEVDKVKVNNIAMWDGKTWSALGDGLNDKVNALAVDNQGALYTGGAFTGSGSKAVNYIAEWDGSGWVGLGKGMDDVVISLAVDSKDNIYAAGTFKTVDRKSIEKIAKWDGNTWSGFGNNITFDSDIQTVKIDSTDHLYAVGGFTKIGNSDVHYIAQWDGSQWLPLDKEVDGFVNTLLFDNSGNFYVGGSFNFAGKVNAAGIARWDSVKKEWSALGGRGVNGSVNVLVINKQGIVYAGGNFSYAGSLPMVSIAAWDGVQWSQYSKKLNGNISRMTIDSAGIIYALGSFSESEGTPLSNFAKWDGTTWSDFAGRLDGASVFIFDNNGNLFAGGDFMINNVKQYIGRWDTGSKQWSPLGSGLNGQVSALEVDIQGNLYAAGEFTMAGNTVVKNIAVWDGNQWNELGLGIDRLTPALKSDGKGNLYAAGYQEVTRWDNSSKQWSSLSGLFFTDPKVLTLDAQGNLYAGGGYGHGGIAKWDDSNKQWDHLGSGIYKSGWDYSYVNTITIDENNRYLYVGGDFEKAGGKSSANFARWTLPGQPCFSLNISISPLGTGSVDITPAANCTSGYTQGTQVTLTAKPSSGYIFNNWSGDASDTTNPLSLPMDKSKTITANFTKLGDVNCDGVSNTMDSLFIMKFVAGKFKSGNTCPPATDMLYLSACDVNKDTICNLTDALWILKCVAGLKSFCP